MSTTFTAVHPARSTRPEGPTTGRRCSATALLRSLAEDSLGYRVLVRSLEDSLATRDRSPLEHSLGYRARSSIDAAGGQLDAAGQADVLEQRAVVGDEQDRPVEAVERRLELLDRRQVEVVRRLVEHEDVGAVGHQQGQRRPGPLARRQRRRRARRRGRRRGRTWPAASGRRRRRGRSRPGTRAARCPAPDSRSRACSTSPTTTLGPVERVAGRQLGPAEHGVEQRRLARPVGARPGRCARRRRSPGRSVRGGTSRARPRPRRGGRRRRRCDPASRT